MRLAVDTNVLLRAIVQDDPKQARSAEAVLRRADTLVISLPVLCEFAWALRSRYGFSLADAHRAISMLVASDRVEVDRPVVQAGLSIMLRGGDFADGCILEQARASRCTLVSFDQRLVRLAGEAATNADTFV